MKLILLFVWSNIALAFDPFSIAAVIGAGANIVSTVVQEASEVSDAASAAGELGDELTGVGEMNTEARRTIALMQEAQQLGNELGYTTEQVAALTGQQDVKSVAGSLRTMTKFVRTGKQVYRMGMKLAQKAEMAQVAMSDQVASQTAIQKTLLELEKQKRLEIANKELSEKVALKRKHTAYIAEVRKSGAKRGGFPRFPGVGTAVKSGINVAKKISPYLLALLAPLFLIRVLMVQFGIFGNQDYTGILDDTIWALILFSSLPFAIEWSFGVGDSLAKGFGELARPAMEPAVTSHSQSDLGTWSLDMLLRICVEVRSVIAALTQGVVDICVGFFISVFPLIVFISRMLKLRSALPSFFALLVSFALWPALWEVTNFFAGAVWGGISENLSFTGVVSGIVVALCNLLLPSVLQKMLTGSMPSDALQSMSSKVPGIKNLPDVFGGK